jgi:hypothetical protein
MYKNILKIFNGLGFVIAFLVVMGSVNKPPGYLPDSLIYQGSLFGLCAVYLFNYWTLQQKEYQKMSTISDVLNVGAIALFLLGLSTKSVGGGFGFMVVILELLPLIATPIFLRKKA